MLEVFKTATTLLSGIYYPTSSLVLNQVYLMAQKIQNFEYEGEIFEQVGKAMAEKLLKYFDEIPLVFTCASALNPTLNVGGVETLIESIAFAFNLTEGNPNSTKTFLKTVLKKCLIFMQLNMGRQVTR